MIKWLANKHPSATSLFVGVLIGFTMAMLLMPNDSSWYLKETTMKALDEGEQKARSLLQYGDAHSDEEVNDREAPLSPMKFHKNSTNSHSGFSIFTSSNFHLNRHREICNFCK